MTVGERHLRALSAAPGDLHFGFSRNRLPVRLGAALLLVLLLASAPGWAGREDLRLLAELFCYMGLASLWNLLAGYAGLVSVGQQAYVGLGGYALFALAILAHVSPLWAIPLSGLFAGVMAVPVAALLFRLRGAYFAIGSWVVAEVFRLLTAQASSLGGGSGTSLPVAMVLAIARSRDLREYVTYWLALGLLVVILASLVALLRSRYGLALTALRDNEVAARSNGIDVGRLKLLVYVGAGLGTGAIGALLFLQKLRISPDAAFSVNDWTAIVIFMTVIGGIGTIEGPLIGAVIFFALRETLADLGSVYLLMLGAVAIAIMIAAPRGLWGSLARHLPVQIVPLRRHVDGGRGIRRRNAPSLTGEHS